MLLLLRTSLTPIRLSQSQKEAGAEGMATLGTLKLQYKQISDCFSALLNFPHSDDECILNISDIYSDTTVKSSLLFFCQQLSMLSVQLDLSFP